jgi:hypothetical protein
MNGTTMHVFCHLRCGRHAGLFVKKVLAVRATDPFAGRCGKGAAGHGKTLQHPQIDAIALTNF